MTIVKQIVNRCHVSESYRSVCREVYRALRPEVRKARNLRQTRKTLYTEAIAQHKENQEIYRSVLGGKL